MRFGTGLCLLVPAVVAACGHVSNAPSDAAYTVNVQRSHAGHGTVTSTIGGIACGTTCSASVSEGTVMALTAVADDGAVFAGWSGPCSDTGPTCTFTVQGDVTVGAAFDVRQDTVTVIPAGNGAGMVTGAPGALSCPGACSVSVDEGTQITLTAAAQADSVFLGWSGSGCSGTGSCAITVNSDQTVIATFALRQSLVVTTGSGSGTGTVTSSPPGIACGSDCSEVYPPGTVVTLTATAASGSRFSGWTGGGCTGTGTCVVTVNAAMMVVAQFDRLCTLTVARLGMAAGTVTSNPSGISCGADCTEDYVCGTTVQLTAAPSGSTFFGWSNGCTGTGACSVRLAASTTINATFTKCGNGFVEAGEECDDGNTSNNDACLNTCRNAHCGDGFTWTGVEQCDDGPTGDSFCTSSCQCGGIGQPCCATGPKCSAGTGCAANNLCSTCPVSDSHIETCQSGSLGPQMCTDTIASVSDIITGSIGVAVVVSGASPDVSHSATQSGARQINFSATVPTGDVFNPGKNTTTYKVSWCRL